MPLFSAPAPRGSPLCVITDWRMRSDAQLDITEPQSAPHVLEMWQGGRAVFGSGYLQTRRLALFEHGSEPDRAQVHRARHELVTWLLRERPRRVLILPSPDAQSGEGGQAVLGTTCFQALGPPDSLEAMRLTFWRWAVDIEVVVGFPVTRRTKHLHSWALAETFKRMGSEQVLEPLATCAKVPAAAYPLLRGMRGKPIAIDLEFIPSSDTTTAVGVSDGQVTVSVPWDAYRTVEGWERSLTSFHYGQQIADELQSLLSDTRTPKYFHNFVADLPRLSRMGLRVRGPVHDTFAAHAIALPELRHGLQVAAASVLCVPPWKSLFRGGDEVEWACDPFELRNYNALDAFYTWHLAQKVLPAVHVDPKTGEGTDGCDETVGSEGEA